VLPAPAAAQDDNATKASGHYDLAVQLLGQGRYREARDEFTRAIEAAPEPVFFCNRAIASLKLDELNAAVRDLTQCRDTLDAAPEELAQIDAQLGAIQTIAAVVRPSATQTAREIAAGPITKKDDPVEDPNNGVSDPSKTSRGALGTVGYTGVAVGVALIASAVTMDVLSGDLVADFQTEAAGGPNTSQAQYDALRARVQRRQRIFWTLSATGAALSAVSIGVIVLDATRTSEGETQDATKTTLELRVGPTSAMVRARF